MLKKLGRWQLNVCLVLLLSILTVLPGYAAVVSEGDAAAVASMTSGSETKYYSTFKEAWDAAKSAKTATVRVLKDCSSTSNAAYNNNESGLNIVLEVPTGVTLNLGTYFIRSRNSGNVLTLRGGGKITSSATNYVAFCTSSGLLNIDGVTLEGTGTYGVQANAGTVVIDGGEFTGKQYALYSNGGTNSVVTIKRGTFHAGTSGSIGVASGYTLSSMLTSSQYAFRYTGSGETPIPGWSQGDTNVLAAALGTVTVEPVPISIVSTSPAVVVLNSGASTSLSVATTLEGVTSEGNVDGVSYQWYQDGVLIDGAVDSSYVLPTDLSPASYNYQCMAAYSGFSVASGITKVTVVSGSNYSCWYSVNDGSARFSTDLNEVFTIVASAAHGEIHLMDNAKFTQSINITGGNITFYAEQYTLSSTANYVFNMNGGQFTLASGTICPDKSRSGYAFYVRGGQLNLNGGTILCDQNLSYGIYGDGGTVSIAGGNIIISGTNGVGVYSGSTSSITISGGTVQASGEGSVGVNVANGGTMTITGGRFLSQGSGNVLNSGLGTTQISGGSFTGTVNCAVHDGSLRTILAPGYAFYGTAGVSGWVTKPGEVSSVTGTVDVRLIPVALDACTETVPILVNGYDSAPVLSVTAHARNGVSPVTYQWYRRIVASDGATDAAYVPLSGETGTSFSIPLGLTNTRVLYACAITCEEYEIRTEDIVVTVAPAEYVHEAPTDVVALFGQTLDTITLVNPEGNSAGTWNWKNSKQYVGNVGIQTFTAVFTPDLSWLYEPVEAEISVTVTKNTPVLAYDESYVASKPLDREYNGRRVREPDSYYVRTVSGKSDAKLQFRWFDSEGTQLEDAPINAGIYEVEAYLPETSNAFSAFVRMRVEIRPRLIEPALFLSRYSYPYSHTANTPTVTVRDGTTTLDASEYSVAYADNINAGTATVTVTDKEGGNYLFEGECVETFDIQKVTVTVTTATAAGKVYDGMADVPVSAVNLSNRVYGSGGADDVYIDTTDLIGYVTYDDSHPDAGTYTRVLFKEALCLQGRDAQNYILSQPTSFVALTAPIEITKYDIPDEDKVVLDHSQEEDVRFVSNRYPHEYMWPLSVMFPTVDSPRRWDHPDYSWTTDLNPAYYKGAASGDSTQTPGGNDIHFNIDILYLPITWDDGNQPYIEDDPADLTDGWVDIGTIRFTMHSRNYLDISYTLHITANTKVTALIIDWTDAPTATYSGEGVMGYGYSDGKHSIGVKPINSDEPAPDVRVNVEYSGSGSTVYPSSTRLPVNAGTYRVIASVDRNNENYIGIDWKNFEILKAPAEYVERPQPADAEQLEYCNAPVSLVKNGQTNHGSIGYSLQESGPFSTAIPFGVSAGTYTVYYRILGDNNHLDSEVESLEVEIVKTAATCTPPRVIQNLRYDGRDTQLVTPGRSNNGTVLYSLDGETYSPDVPTAKEVGAYTVYYMVQGDANHYDSEPAILRTSIGIVNLSVRYVNAINKVYDGTDDIEVVIVFYESVANDDLGVQCTAKLALEEGELPHVGTYERVNITDLHLTGTDAGNYRLPITELTNYLAERPVEITRAATTSKTVNKYVQIYSPREYEWDLNELIPDEIPESLRSRNPAEFTVNLISFEEPYYSGGARIQDGKFIIPIDEVDALSSNRVGSVTIDLRFENYQNCSGVFVLYSGFKPDEEITGVTSAGQVVYTGSGIRGFVGTPSSRHEGSYDITYAGVAGTVYPGGESTSTTVQPVDTGNYSVTIRIPSSNQEYSGSITLTFEIVKADPVVDGIEDNTSIFYNGEEQVLLPDAGVNGGTLMFALLTEEADENAVPSGADYTPELPTAKEIGEYVVWYKVVGNNNFNDLAPRSVKVSIVQVPPLNDSEKIPVTSIDLMATSQDGVGVATLRMPIGEMLATQASDRSSDVVEVTFALEGDAPDEMKVVLESGAINALASRTDADLQLVTPVASAMLPAGSMDALAAESTDAVITLKRAEDSVEVTLSLGSGAAPQLSDGMVVRFPCEETSPGTVAVLLGEDGSRTLVRGSVLVNGTLAVPISGSATILWFDNSQRFADVAEDHWASEAVAFVGSHALMKGVGVNRFDLSAPMTRSMLTQVLYNLENTPEVTQAAAFRDVSSFAWYADAVAWATANGVVNGYGDGVFGPEDSVTRQQIAAILYRYLGSPATDVKTLEFTDADEVEDYAQQAICWAIESGLFTGRGEGILAPRDTATRAEIAVLLKRLCVYAAGIR